MDLQSLMVLIIGGGGIGALVSAFLTRQTNKEKNDIELLDRAYKEIERLDSKVMELEKKLDEKEGENEDLKRLVAELRAGMDKLKSEMDLLKRRDKTDGTTTK